jgi:hypothetical protein
MRKARTHTHAERDSAGSKHDNLIDGIFIATVEKWRYVTEKRVRVGFRSRRYFNPFAFSGILFFMAIILKRIVMFKCVT